MIRKLGSCRGLYCSLLRPIIEIEYFLRSDTKKKKQKSFLRTVQYRVENVAVVMWQSSWV